MYEEVLLEIKVLDSKSYFFDNVFFEILSYSLSAIANAFAHVIESPG